ncbi:MAG: PTS fructose transporter subunit IIA [Pseudomonadota bacterium]
MIGIVIVAHGNLADSLLAATEHVVGKQENARAVAIQPSDDLHDKQAEINAMVGEVNSGQGVVLITDMFGGTPSNLALGALTSNDIEVIYGANLPLLVKLAKSRERALADAVKAALEAGHKYIDSAANMLDMNAGNQTG